MGHLVGRCGVGEKGDGLRGECPSSHLHPPVANVKPPTVVRSFVAQPGSIMESLGLLWRVLVWRIRREKREGRLGTAKVEGKEVKKGEGGWRKGK